MHPSRRRALERRLRNLQTEMGRVQERLAALPGRTDLTERGRKQQTTLLQNRIKQLQTIMGTIRQALDRG